MASQVINGKAFEWAVGAAIAQQTGFDITLDKVATHNQSCFDSVTISKKQRDNYTNTAHHAVQHILEKECLTGTGTITFLPDIRGQDGDVRDIVITSAGKTIGISCKTNHDAYKHSRLSKKLNFVSKWGLDTAGCSAAYFDSITPLFDELAKIRKDGKDLVTWAELTDKPNRFYWPVLDAFATELERIQSPKMCGNFIKYLVGNHDFYKVVSRPNAVAIQAFNLNGMFNVSKPQLPTKIDLIKNKNGTQYSKTIIFDKGWSFNFRIHSASSKVEASLKFDINAIALSPKLYTHHIDL
ncbi:MAG: HaeIII family restriction endonuclease [Sulfuriferula sp.]|nr:HaeIII family restriction endonuclease [Sulfuriferula sp.]